MATTIANLAVQVYQRLEENPAAPVYWTQYEVYTALVEAMNEAALLTGVVQTVQSTTIDLPTDTNFVPMPTGAIALLRVVAAQAVQKTELFVLDQLIPSWETQGGAGANPAVQKIQYWFPLGLDQFGIYPKLTADQQVKVTYLSYPVAETRPYTGAETVPFQVEFQDALQQYAAHILRMKEATAEFDESQAIYQQFLDTMRSLSVFQARHDSLVFSRSIGAPVRVVPVEVR